MPKLWVFWGSENFTLIEVDICHDFWLPIIWTSSLSFYKSRKFHLLPQLPLKPKTRVKPRDQGSVCETHPQECVSWIRSQRCTDTAPAENSPRQWVHSSAVDDSVLMGPLYRSYYSQTGFPNFPTIPPTAQRTINKFLLSLTQAELVSTAHNLQSGLTQLVYMPLAASRFVLVF